MEEHNLQHTKLGRLDRFLLRVLRVRELSVSTRKQQKGGARGVLRLYFGSLKQFPVSVALSIVGVIVGSASGVLQPFIFKKFLDVVSAQPFVEQSSVLTEYIVGFTLLGCVGWLGWRISFLATAYVAAGMLARLRQRAFAYLIEHSYQFFTTSFTGSLVQRVNRFASSYDRLADRFLFDVIPIIVQVTFIMVILSREHVGIALIILVWIVIFVGWNYTFAKWKLKYDISRAAQDSRATAQLADSITNQQTIELYRSQAFENKRYKEVTDLQSLYARFSWQSSNLIDGVQALFVIAVQFLVMYFGIQLWQKGQMSVSMFVLVQTYIIQLADRLWSFSRVVRDVYESFADAKEMADIMYKPHDIVEIENPKVLHDSKGGITFEHVGFSFNNKKVIDDLNINILPGEKVALVGVSGAGKSTIVKLLFRQYDVNQGVIRIDGENIRELSLRSLRGALSLVPQDPVLFHRSLLDNMRYGKPDATDEEVIRAAKLAHCDEFIENLPQAYNTLVGERGIRLSGGERQRVAIARAFLRNSPILILDEATSSLDSHSEERIQDALMKLMEGKTTIIIAHRLSTIRRMDRIIVLKDGKVLEDGTHDALLNNNGTYAMLWNIQQGGFLEDDNNSL
jgi:ATP-binding cassette subfamily B protein